MIIRKETPKEGMLQKASNEQLQAQPAHDVVKLLIIHILCTQLVQGSQKGVEMEPKWSLRAPQITKNQEKWALKKTLKNNTAKSGFVVAF